MWSGSKAVKSLIIISVGEPFHLLNFCFSRRSTQSERVPSISAGINLLFLANLVILSGASRKNRFLIVHACRGFALSRTKNSCSLVRVATVACWDKGDREKRQTDLTFSSTALTANTSSALLIYQMGGSLSRRIFNDMAYLAWIATRRPRESSIAHPKKFYEFLTTDSPCSSTGESERWLQYLRMSGFYLLKWAFRRSVNFLW